MDSFTNFVTRALSVGGKIVPLIVNNLCYKGTGLFNPSVYYDAYTDRIYATIRHCQYTLFHSEKNKFEHQFGPLVYLNPENDITLTTKNYFCVLNQDLSIQSERVIDTSKLDVKPLWEFVGLEDVRLVNWGGDMYATGVRRDTTTNGQGRMELSKLEIDDSGVREVFRYRIPTPPPDDSYCEKNWMPVIDMPFHYVKWSNPTQVVKVNIEEKKTETVYLDETKYVPMQYDYRGGSQVIPLGDNHRIACAHVVWLYKSEAGRKNARYRHCFVVWDKNWNVVRYTEPFDFMGAEIEFCTGMTQVGDDFIMTFGFQDNAAFALRVPYKLVEDICLN